MKINKLNLNWRTMDDVRKALAKSDAGFEGTRVNLNGMVINGSDLRHPSDDQDEKSIGIRISIPKFYIVNGTVDNVPGGMIALADNITFDDLDFRRIGEDAISNVVDKSRDLTIRNCEFHGASDESIQINDARGLTLSHNCIVGGITGAIIQESKTKYKNIKTKLVEYMVFDGCDTAYNISGGCIVTAKDTVYRDVRMKVVTNHGGKLIEI